MMFANFGAIDEGKSRKLIARFSADLPGGFGEAEANLRLAAAAPELLEALESLRGIEAWISDREMKEMFQRKVYPIIDKARGQ